MFPTEGVAVQRFRGTGSVLPRRAIVGLLAMFAGFAVLTGGVALADTVTTNFEAPAFSTTVGIPPPDTPLGSVNGQGGWKSAVPGDIPSLPHGYDQAVVANAAIPGHPAPDAFGAQSLRISNAYAPDPGTAPPEFHFQTYSTPTIDAAGQDLTNTEYTAQFSFISVHPNQQQPGLQISVSPDNGEGGRMSYVGLLDTPTGIEVTFYDTNPAGEWVPFNLGVLPRGVPHTIKIWMRLIPGPNNDLVRIAIDGKDAGQCFTTWESSYGDNVPISDRLLFLSGNRQGNDLSLLGGGYLFDNVSVTTGGAGPPGCDLPIEKQADSRTVTAGGHVGYRLSVRNRGRLSERNLLFCDHIPRHTTFVSADRKLRRVGARRCLFIPVLRPRQRASVHLVLHVNANAPPGPLENTADLAPDLPPVLPPAPPSTMVPDVPGKVTTTPPVIKKVKAVVTVRAKPKRVHPPPPRVTG
jgi:uncharacterized repeat protein (TIGR01451 family)